MARSSPPLDPAEVRAVAAAIRAEPEIKAVAVCLLFSYLNPAHEQAVKAILAEELPGLPLSISYEVLPKWKEYERASTTLADAYLKPVVSGRLRVMRERLDAAGVGAHTVVIRSNGGEMTLDAAAAAPIQMLVSGPTGGVIASRHVAGLTGLDHLVTLDMGGTSTDVATVIGGKEAFTTAFEIEWGVPIQIPMIDIRTIGAGGGSLAWIDKGGMLRVGPQSAGAAPGPACYGQGGTEATVTDANLVLGRLNPDYFLGGRMTLDADAAHRAVAAVAERLGRTVPETALAIVRIADNNMVGALRSVLIERGLDPRDFTLCAFGGAGPLHAAALMREMGLAGAIVPNHPGQFSALGFILTDARVDRQRTTQLTSNRFDPARAREIMATLVEEAAAELAQQGYTQRHRGPARPGDALSRPELRARAARRRRRPRRRCRRAPLAVLPRRPRGPLRLRHPGRHHRDRHLHRDRDLAHRPARAATPAAGRRPARARGRAPRPAMSAARPRPRSTAATTSAPAMRSSAPP